MKVVVNIVSTLLDFYCLYSTRRSKGMYPKKRYSAIAQSSNLSVARRFMHTIVMSLSQIQCDVQGV